MTRDDINEYVAGWIDAWNRRDVEAVIQHFAEDVEFTSPVAAAVVGNATVRGKEALRAYWLAALGRIGALRFTLDRAIHDADRRELAIVYRREVDGSNDRVCELLTFDDAGLIVRGEVMYGVKETT